MSATSSALPTLSAHRPIDGSHLHQAFAHQGDAAVPKVETSVRKVLDRLSADGWIVEGGTKHTKLRHPDRAGIKILVPRHRELEPGTARSIARAAGWI